MFKWSTIPSPIPKCRFFGCLHNLLLAFLLRTSLIVNPIKEYIKKGKMGHEERSIINMNVLIVIPNFYTWEAKLFRRKMSESFSLDNSATQHKTRNTNDRHIRLQIKHELRCSLGLCMFDHNIHQTKHLLILELCYLEL